MRWTYILLFVLCASSAFAATLFEGEKIENEFFTISGEEMQFDYYPSAARISWNAFGTWTQIDKGSCKVIEKFDICFDDVGDEVEDEEHGIRYMIELTISDLAPKLEIELEADDESVDIDQDVEVTATISNEGNSAATGLTFYVNFPQSVHVLSSTAVKNGNTVTWQGNLDPGEEEEILITLELEEFSDFSAQAEVTSTINGQIAKVESNVMDVSVNLPYEIDIEYSDTTLKKNEFFDLEIAIDNTDAEELEFDDLVISYPKSFKLLSKPAEWTESEGEVKLAKTFLEGDDASYDFSFQALSDGEYTFNINAHAELPDFDIDSAFEQDIVVNSKDVIATIDVPETVKELDSYSLEVTLENIVDEDVLVIYELSSDAFINIYKKTLSLGAGDDVVILDQRFKAPEVDSSKEYTITLEVTSGAQTQTITKEFTVTPRKELISFREEIDVDGDEAHVTVYATNLHTKELEEVDLIDDVPSSVDTTGERFATLTLPVGETKVYEYFVRTEEGGTVELTHTANVNTDDGLYILEVPFEISFDEVESPEEAEEEIPDEAEESTAEESADEDSQEDSSQEGYGFFSGILAAIGNFFGTIFG